MKISKNLSPNAVSSVLFEIKMNSIFFLVIVGCAWAAPDLFPTKEKRDGRIVGGKPVNIEDYPYQLGLRHKNELVCGASIISELWALTAAHCGGDDKDANNYILISSSTVINDDFRGGINHPALKVCKHELYSVPSKHDYDVAVIKVGIPFLSSNSIASVVVLPAPGSAVNAGAVAVVSGYGDTRTSEDFKPNNHLHAVQVPIVSWSECAKRYLDLSHAANITERMICAAMEGGKDACHGDSGGPLIVDNKQFGIVSWGGFCVYRDQPSVYANVGNKEIRTWITDKTGV